MNFFTNKIVNPAGYNGPSFEEWVADFLTKTAQEKVASEAKPECDDDPRGQCRGQVINNDNEQGAGQSYQDGESVHGKDDQGGNARPDTGGTTDQKTHEQTDKGGSSQQEVKATVEEVKEAKCGKDMGESSDAGKVTEDHTEAGPGDDENPEPKILINNDPCYQKGESTDPGKLDNKKQPGEQVVGKGKKAASKKVASKKAFKKVASLDRKERLQLFAVLSANENNPMPYVEAMTGLKFANLEEEEKAWFRDFWKILYPPEYVEEMVADR